MTSIDEKERITRQGFLASLALLVPMVYAVVVSNSTAVLADGLNLAMDTFAMYLSWHVIRRLKLGRTETYNYGFDKFENLLALGFAAANLVFVVLVLVKAADGLRQPEPLEGTAAAIILNLVAVALFSALWLGVRRMGEAGRSPVMDAQRRYYLMSIADSMALVIPLSLAALFKDQSWSLYIDPVTAIALCAFFLYQIWAMAAGSVYDLVDRALEERLQLAVLRVLASRFDDYDAFRGVRTRRAGGVHFIEIMLGYDPALSMGAVQLRINAMKVDLEVAIPNSVVLVCPTDGAAGTAFPDGSAGLAAAG